MRPRSPVSVVIPTIGRATVADAVASATYQQGIQPEVIVVVDGNDNHVKQTQDHLRSFEVTLVQVPSEFRFMGHARNIGIEHSRTEITALLDDDDLWTPYKLRAQLGELDSVPDNSLLTSAVITFDRRPRDVWPSRPFDPTEPLEAFLFHRQSIRPQPNHLQTSTWLARTDTFRAHPFSTARRIHQDWDWLANHVINGPVPLNHMHEALTYYRLSDASSVSTRTDLWRESMEWCLSAPISPRSQGDAMLAAAFSLAIRARNEVAAASVFETASARCDPSYAARLVAHLKYFRLRAVSRRSRARRS